MPKADTELVKMVIQRHEIGVQTTAAIIQDILDALKAEDGEDKTHPAKKQFVFLLSDPKGELEGKDFVGWVLQIPEEDSAMTAEERLIRSAYEFNITPKGRRMPLKTIAEVCEHVSGRITKEQGLWIKTKEPVYVLCTGGKVPFDEIKKLRRRNDDQADESTAYKDGEHEIRVTDDGAK
jgi:hypothetical protein